MGSQIQKSHIRIIEHPSYKLQRPQAKAVFIEVRVNDPGTPINYSLIESDNFFIDHNMIGCQDKYQTIVNTQKLEEKKKTYESNNFHIQPLKGILKKETSISKSPFFNEEAKFVKFQINPQYFSSNKPRVINKIKTTRKSRILTLL
ncbi:unnamed protein product [Paramecium sonneborni]|uniref:Uncharacterized protein n=1 Tax=Paramecium sonneborni TaxID=65129 RepID=A0A8S1Q4J4_9CILI|nr:unnamed protein product [Paramecium sonneborni]